jgi:hypothetical protein
MRGRLEFSKDDDEAVVFITWHDASAFCRWLSNKEGLPYRLPTEAEWEYACRAGGDDFYHTGDTLPEPLRKHPADSWYPDPSNSSLADVVGLHVGRTPPNRWGLYDMHGNVEEWCHDWYGPYRPEEQTDPVGYATGDFKVTRGGSHSTELYYLRSANRLATLPGDSSWLIGLRVVMGELPPSAPLPAPHRPRCQARVRQVRPADMVAAPPADKPHFSGPKQFVKIPPASYGPLWSEHNHVPALVECPNGDMLAVWFSCYRERGREMALAASRLRYGSQEWEPASSFWDVPDHNMTGTVLWRDGQDIHCVGALAVAGTWGNNCIYMRSSSDSGATWSPARLIVPDHGIGQVCPIHPPFTAQDGSLVLTCDDANLWMTQVYISRDGGETWRDPGGRIDGIHAPVVQLTDSRLLAFGRLKNGDPRPMPQSISADMGGSFAVSDSPFDPIFSGQRPTMIRLREGPLFFASFARKMVIKDITGRERSVAGLFGALSYDEGQTWPVRRLISDDGQGRWLNGEGWTMRFIMSHTYAEPKGYLASIQATNGLIHLISSNNHYTFNQTWLETPAPAAAGDGLL